MQQIVGEAEVLRGTNGELHIAPDGLALVPKTLTEEQRPEAARWSEVEGVSAEPSAGRLAVTLRGGRGEWHIQGAVRPEVLWALDAIEREIARARAREGAIFQGRAALDKLAEAIAGMSAGVEAQPTVIAELLCLQAVRNRATDLHLQPVGDRTRARLRIDGMLHEVGEMPREVGRRVIARLKVLAEMKSYATGAAQTGRLYLPVDGRTVDMRLTALPTVHGEKLTARIFDSDGALLQVSALGMDPATLAAFRAAIHAPEGCVITTGPAGAGKTTTAYASLAELRDGDGARSISTVEEPVELDLAGVDQTEIDRDRGLDFAAALRTVLRQDPQVIMVGEVRDGETAQIAMQAALTGHLVLTTVHAPDAAGVFARLMDLGLEPYLVASSISAVIAQRLVRVLCPDCAGGASPTDEELAATGLSRDEIAGWNLREARGCATCSQTGYLGRTGIFELLPMTAELRAAILERKPIPEIERMAKAAGVGDLWQAGLEKVRAGETTLAELIRVLGRRNAR